MALVGCEATTDTSLEGRGWGEDFEAARQAESESDFAQRVLMDDVVTDAEMQEANERLVSHEVCPRLVAEVISHWTGVPVAQLAREHNSKVAGFADDLRQRIRDHVAWARMAADRIAAAPELLEALRWMLNEYERLHALFDLGDCQATVDARAAIEKATGGAA